MLSLATGLHTVHYLLPDRLRDSKKGNRDQLQRVSHKEEEIKVTLLLKFFQIYGGEMHFGEISLIIVNVLYLIGLQVKKERKKGCLPSTKLCELLLL